MESRRGVNRMPKAPLPLRSPLENTLHKASNGEISITCRNRHCPKCQTQARNRWVAARTRELVPLNYFHVVFTVPHQLSELMLQNKRLLYNLLFRCVADTLLEVAANPKRLGAEIGFLCVLHTWGQTLIHHPHIHCVVPAGGLAPGRNRWIRPKSAGFFLPKEVLSVVFRGKFCNAFERPLPPKETRVPRLVGVACRASLLCTILHTLHTHKWVVDVRKPFAGRNMSCTIWPATRIGWPSPTTG